MGEKWKTGENSKGCYVGMKNTEKWECQCVHSRSFNGWMWGQRQGEKPFKGVRTLKMPIFGWDTIKIVLMAPKMALVRLIEQAKNTSCLKGENANKCVLCFGHSWVTCATSVPVHWRIIWVALKGITSRVCSMTMKWSAGLVTTGIG